MKHGLIEHIDSAYLTSEHIDVTFETTLRDRTGRVVTDRPVWAPFKKGSFLEGLTKTLIERNDETSRLHRIRISNKMIVSPLDLPEADPPVPEKEAVYTPSVWETVRDIPAALFTI